MGIVASEFDNVIAEQYRWKNSWHVWEFLILRHNNNIKQKSKMKKFLNPLLILNKKAIRFVMKEGIQSEDIVCKDAIKFENSEIMKKINKIG